MSNSNAEKNKAIVLEAFDTLFNKRNYSAAERFWSPKYIQHSAHIVRLKDGILVEHWDVIQDEATEQQSKSGNPMFGDSFPK